MGGSILTVRTDPGIFHVHGSEEKSLHQLGASRSDGFHQDLPRHQDILFSQFHPTGQRPHWLLRLQPPSCCLPYRSQEWAGLWPGDADPLDSRWRGSSCFTVFSYVTLAFVNRLWIKLIFLIFQIPVNCEHPRPKQTAVQRLNRTLLTGYKTNFLCFFCKSFLL